MFHFEMAHMLPYHNGQCKNIHGHSYHLHVTVRGKIRHEAGHPEDGMVMDFTELKKIVNSSILEKFDHSLVLPEKAAGSISLDTRLVYVNESPTCEVLLLEFVNRVRELLPEGVDLVKMRLSETASSYAEWTLEDNLNEYELT